MEPCKFATGVVMTQQDVIALRGYQPGFMNSRELVYMTGINLNPAIFG